MIKKTTLFLHIITLVFVLLLIFYIFKGYKFAIVTQSISLIFIAFSYIINYKTNMIGKSKEKKPPKKGSGMKVFHLLDIGYMNNNKFISFFNWYYAPHKHPWVLLGFGIRREINEFHKYFIINFFGKTKQINLNKYSTTDEESIGFLVKRIPFVLTLLKPYPSYDLDINKINKYVGFDIVKKDTPLETKIINKLLKIAKKRGDLK